MSLATQHKNHLEALFGDRVTFERLERKLYGHDVAAMPNLIKPLVGDTTPDAVVQPRSEEQLAELVRWADEQRIPLTPRGKASSGFTRPLRAPILSVRSTAVRSDPPPI
jgi:FAD/FMN-containing dehydrogenase